MGSRVHTRKSRHTSSDGEADMPKPKILVIEDERALVEPLAYNLEREGFDVLVAYDGQDGLRQAQLKLPDLIVLDLMLPVKSGLEVCRELRNGTRTREIPIVMVTAKAEETDQLVGFAMGADDYVTKPYSIKVLIERVKKELRKRQAQDEPSSGSLIESQGVTIDRVVLERTIDVHVKSLRKKLGDAADLIETVRGVGYRFHEARLVES